MCSPTSLPPLLPGLLAPGKRILRLLSQNLNLHTTPLLAHPKRLTPKSLIHQPQSPFPIPLTPRLPGTIILKLQQGLLIRTRHPDLSLGRLTPEPRDLGPGEKLLGSDHDLLPGPLLRIENDVASRERDVRCAHSTHALLNQRLVENVVL